MKNIRVLFVVLFASLFTMTTVNAANSNAKPENNLRTEVIDLLGAPDLSFTEGGEIEAKLLFMINDNNELILIDSGTENVYLENYLRTRLNYKKVNTDNIAYYKFYAMNVQFRK